MRNRLLLLALLALAAAGLWLALRGGERGDQSLRGEGAGLPAEPASASARLSEHSAAQQEGDESETAEDASAIKESPTAPKPAQAPPSAPLVSQPPKTGPIRLFGTITANGEPAAVQIGLIGRLVMTWTDATGGYELGLPEPSRRVPLLIKLEETVSFTVTAPAPGPGDQRFDVEIPIGSVEGHVYGPDGPLAGVEVRMQVDFMADPILAEASATSDADGRYAVDKLPAGTWRIRAGGGGTIGGLKPTFLTPAEVRGLIVAGGQSVNGIDLHLGAAGIVSGLVLTAEGKPARDAVIRVRRPSGELAEPIGIAHVDFQGRFSIGGIEPGWNTICALDGLQRCAEVAVAVQPLVESQIELRLAPATFVRLLVRPAPGAMMQRITCQRSDGADFSTWTVEAQEPWPPTGERHFGPLPPGTYTFTVERELEPPSSQTVIIEDEKEIVLVL